MLSYVSNQQTHCRAGWIAACTTALCLQFDSPTLGPHFPIPRPIALLLHHIALGRVAVHCVTLHHVGSVALLSSHIASHWIVSHRVTLHQVMSQRIGSVALLSGHITSHQVASHRITSGWVRSHRITSGCIASGRVTLPWVSRAIINPIWFSLYLHTSLFSFCHCDPGRLSLTLALPYPCHLSLHYF